MYIGVLEDGLVDVHKEVYDNLGNPFFQQDNANIRTAKDTMAWFEEHNIQVMTWPANSPDMNPIEHMWKRLKETVHKRFPESQDTQQSGQSEKGPCRGSHRHLEGRD